MISHVVFDFDGTLASSLEAVLGLYNEIAARERFGRLTADNLEELRALPMRERCRRLGVPLYRLPGLMLEVGRSYGRALRSIDFNAGIPALLQELRAQGLELMILSSNSEENIRAFLAHREASALVQDVFCSSNIFGKARLLRALMKRHRLQPHQLVYVGDEQRDIEACREVGVRVIAVRWGADAEALLRQAGPDALVETPAEVAEHVARWRKAS